MKTTLWKPKSISELTKELNAMEEQNGHRFEGLNHVTNQSDKRNIVTYSDDETVSQLHSQRPEAGFVGPGRPEDSELGGVCHASDAGARVVGTHGRICERHGEAQVTASGCSTAGDKFL